MTTETPFLEKVRVKGQLEDISQSKDVTEVVYRTMRDLMTTDAADRVAIELRKDGKSAKVVPTVAETPQKEVADLWQDTDPIAGALSRIEPPQKFDADGFLYMIDQEADLPQGVTPETVVQAVFSATKQELSPERVEEVASFLPGKIQQLWQQA